MFLIVVAVGAMHSIDTISSSVLAGILLVAGSFGGSLRCAWLVYGFGRSLRQAAAKGTTHLHEQAVALALALPGFRLGAREFGSAEEAADMAKRAVAHMAQHGSSELIADINILGKGRFVDRDLYLSVYSLGFQCVAHGANPRLAGVDGTCFKDAEGKLFVRDIVTSAGAKGCGWVDYQWAHPVTKKILRKSTYFERAEDLVIACGFYKS
ncbi:MAG: cache domain-containing protein [Burkholderiaceae bacterium]